MLKLTLKKKSISDVLIVKKICKVESLIIKKCNRSLNMLHRKDNERVFDFMT